MARVMVTTCLPELSGLPALAVTLTSESDFFPPASSVDQDRTRLKPKTKAATYFRPYSVAFLRMVISLRELKAFAKASLYAGWSWESMRVVHCNKCVALPNFHGLSGWIVDCRRKVLPGAHFPNRF